MHQKKIENKSKKINSKDFKLYIFENNSWVKEEDKIPIEVKKIISKYKLKKNIQNLIDKKDSKFLKGFLNKDNLPSGQRIKILPNGKKIARGGFSIFAKNLKLNENEKSLWDIVYENSSGTKTYLYSEDKIEIEHKKKAKLVDKFAKEYPKINRKLNLDLKNKNEIIYFAIKILLETKIRIGNYEYYNHLGHMGLTTLKKENLKIDILKNEINFNYIAKDGVPRNFSKKFDKNFIMKFKKILDKKTKNEFVFSGADNLPIHSYEFSKILFNYTKIHFYPHIIRSYFADSVCKDFLKYKRKSTKEEVDKTFLKVAKELGHKKYNKKKEIWENNFKVTINNYIRPQFSKRMINLYKNK